MAGSAQEFARLLTEAVHTIRIRETKVAKKTIRLVQDELGYALGREGGSCIEYWRKGNVPATLEDLEALARELVKRNGLTREALKQLLASAGHPQPAALTNELYPLRQEFAPFVVGPPITHPRQFFGREQELKRIFGLWKRFPLQNVAVIGLPRCGKTSLLRYLQQITAAAPAQLRPGQRADWLPQPERYRWVLVDFQDARMGQPESLLRYLLTSLNLPVPEPCRLSNFLDTVGQYLQNPAVIMMDEIGAGLASPELDQQFWWSLRSLSNYTEGKLGFLLTAHETPALLAHEYGKPSPFFNIFGHTLQLGPFNEAEARELLASSPKPFAPADVEWMLAQSGRWPVLLQILGETCLTALEEGQAGPAWRAEGLSRIAPLQYLLEAAC
ncbi:MAG: ATP-binding protein [Anaerolineales bacterium]|nr:ATP-binding protein [Anaerolineales bacterium]